MVGMKAIREKKRVASRGQGRGLRMVVLHMGAAIIIGGQVGFAPRRHHIGAPETAEKPPPPF